MTIKKDVTVNITRQSKPLSQAGFGTPVILVTDGVKAYREYYGLDDVSVDYAPTKHAYMMANALFAQNPCPEKVGILGVSYTGTPPTQATYTTAGTTNSNFKLTAKPLGTSGNNVKLAMIKPSTDTPTTTAVRTGTGTSLDPYIITVNLAVLSSAITAKGSDVITAIQADINSNAIVSVALATGNDGTGLCAVLTATALTGGVDGSDTTPLINALNTLINTNNDWYFLLSDCQALNEIVSLDTWVEAQKKNYCACTSDITVSTYMNGDRTFVMVHDHPETYPDCAWVGYCSTFPIGSINWKAKTLNGIAAVGFTGSQMQQILDNGGNTYVSKYGALQTSSGLTTSGEYIDVIQGQDWLEATMEQEVSMAIYSQPKVPYDNRGISIVESAVKTVLRKGVIQEIIAVDDNNVGLYTVSMPKRSQTSSSDRAARKYTGSWTAQQAGAIDTIILNGILTY